MALGLAGAAWSPDQRWLAFNRIASDMIKEGRVQIIEKFDLPEPKTKTLGSLLKKLGVDARGKKGALILVDEPEDNA